MVKMVVLKRFWSQVDKVILLQAGVMVAVVVAPMIDMTICGASATSAADLPWNKGVSTMKDAMTGDIPKAGAVIACASSGIMLAFGESQGMAKKGIQATFGAGIALGAPSMVDALTSPVQGLFF